ASGTVWGSLLASMAIVLPSLIIMGLICYLYESIRNHWSENRYFQISMRIIRILVVLLIANAAYRLMTPQTFIDYRSWIIFAVAGICTLLPELRKNKVTEYLSHPILLIILAGIVGYILY
ncbi:MAG: chromate transporter, partial [Paludibacteraceae bacterium]|nr:chromate transporter [Paludibacteraceae bacterium]